MGAIDEADWLVETRTYLTFGLWVTMTDGQVDALAPVLQGRGSTRDRRSAWFRRLRRAYWQIRRLRGR